MNFNNLPKLSPTEIKVLYLLTQGLENEEIANIMNVSTHTIKAHIQSILRKLEAKNRTHAACIAIINKLISLP